MATFLVGNGESLANLPQRPGRLLLDCNKQHYEDGAINPFGGAVLLFVDVMSTNNDGTSLATASANPNFGRPFVINNNNPTNFNYISDREDSRATAFVKHDFKKGSDVMVGIDPRHPKP